MSEWLVPVLIGVLGLVALVGVYRSFRSAPEGELSSEPKEKPKPSGWFIVDESAWWDTGTYYREVQGGRLYMTRMAVYHGGGVAMCFVPSLTPRVQDQSKEQE